MEVHGKRIGVEFKRADAPHATRSMHLAITDTALDKLWVVYPGTRSYALADRITVRSLSDCIKPRRIPSGYPEESGGRRVNLPKPANGADGLAFLIGLGWASP